MSLPRMTKKELSEVAGYTYRRLHDIDMGLPEGKKLFVADEEGKYDLALFVQRWVAFNVDRESVDIDDLSVVKARHEIVKTKKTELEVEKLRGQLIDVQDVKRLWADIASSVMQNFSHLPSKLAPMLLMMDNSEQIAAILDEEIRAILNNISDTPLPDYADEQSQAEPEEDGDDE